MQNASDQPIDPVDQLIKKYPALFQNEKRLSVYCPPGWVNLLDTIFNQAYHAINQVDAHIRLLEQINAETSNPESIQENLAQIKELQEQRVKLVQEAPQVLQVKEKFGALRVYISSSDPGLHAVCDAMGYLSYQTCQECGAPGKVRSGGWIRTLCDKHARAAKLAKDLSD